MILLHLRARPGVAGRVARGGGGLLVLLLAGQVIFGAADGSIPVPAAVLHTVWRLGTGGELGAALGYTAQVSAVGLALAVLVAVPCGLLLGAIPVAGAAARHLVELLRPIPSVALVPIALLLADSIEQVHLIVTAYASCWPVLLATVYAVQQVDPLRIETARVYGSGRMATAVRVLLPSAVPGIVTGVRTAVAVAVVVAVGSEIVGGGDAGLGGLAVAAAQTDGSGATVLACALAAAVLGLAGDLVVRAARTLVGGWQDHIGAGAS
ncbi:ABC transporter permease subunit [Streptomyces sp. NPDC005500]|uniref:ABC transporter permease n=1 Tax=Streptomyces sp. NPDC005500 TaxID=3155007 RepID=UPI0033B18699